LRIAVISNMVDPNRVALFERVARMPDVELFVAYETTMEANRGWTPAQELPYRHEILRSRSIDLRRLGTDAYLHLPTSPLSQIKAFRPDVVVGAGGGIWSSPANILAFAARKREGWAFVPWWGSFQKSQPSRARRIAEPWVRHFTSRSDLCIAYGTRAARELERLGVAAEAIRTVPNSVPPGDRGSAEPRPHRPLRYLFVGQLIDRKGVADLLTAFSGLPEGELHVAGDGDLKHLVTEAENTGRVKYHGHLKGPELQRLYGEADVLVLPSHYEVWGLVINEALEHGLPIVASDNVGAVDDLIVPGVNGYVTASGDVASLRETLAQFRTWDSAQWLAAASTGEDIARRWSIDAAARAFVDACRDSRARHDGQLS
jgi:glycosyltransferase involved in cell wall biosynthesis